MKPLFILLILSIVVGCANIQSKQQRAESTVEDYLEKALNDPHSYESVSFKKLDTLYASPMEDTVYKQMWDKVEDVHIKLLTARIDVNYPRLNNVKLIAQNIKKLMLDSIRMSKPLDSLESVIRKKQIGWSIYHTYRAKNGFGALTLSSTIFDLDKELTKVIDTVNDEK